MFVQQDVGPRSGFSSSGRVQAIEAEQLLRAAQVGGLSDARLELNVYQLLVQQGRSCGPWLGEELTLREAGTPADVCSASALRERPSRRSFRRVEHNPEPYLELSCREFQELDAAGHRVAQRALEYVMPRRHAAVTASVAVLRRAGNEVLLGLDDDDLPAAQCFVGRSDLLVTPAWRLPLDVQQMTPAKQFVRERLEQEYGLELGDLVALGGKYHPTSGATPEVVHPFAVEVLGEQSGSRALLWTPLRELVDHPQLLRDGHLRIVALRAAHALDLMA
jgi:hypothetical protein